MLYFKDDTGKVYGLTETQLNLKKADWVEISEAEMLELTSPELPLDRQKENKIAELNFDFSQSLNEPYSLNGKLYQLNSADLSYFETLFNSADEIDFILNDNSTEKLNKSDFETLKQMMAQRRNELTLKLRDLKNQIEKAENIQTLKGIKWR
mgnify:CR=1 FL=1